MGLFSIFWWEPQPTGAMAPVLKALRPFQAAAIRKRKRPRIGSGGALRRACSAYSERYSATVCTTLPTGRPAVFGFSILVIIASYSGSVSSWVLGFIQTTL